MSLQLALDIALSALGAILMFLLSKVWARIDRLDGDLQSLRVETARDYAGMSDLRDMRQEILEHLRRIEDKLDAKVDKE